MTDLATLKDSILAPQYSDDVFDKTRSSVKYLPRIELCTASSVVCKEGKIPVNHYALKPDSSTLIDLGKEVDVLVLDWHPKAIDLSDIEKPVQVFDPESKLFRDIQERSEDTDSGCMFGVEFLVYVGSIGRFATLFCGSKTNRRMSPDIKANMHKLATLSNNPIKTKKYSWVGMKAVACTTPLQKTPNVEEVQEAVTLFRKEPTDDVELASNDTATQER